MLDILLEKSITQKKDITSFFENIQENLDIEKIKDSYNVCLIPEISTNKVFAAVDGSFNKKKLIAAFVYAITSQSIIYDPKDYITKESSTADVNYISSTQTSKIGDILSQQMSILELKSTIDTLQKHPNINYMLLDGSISGDLLYISTNYQLNPIIKKYLKIYMRELYDQIKNQEFKLEVRSIKQQDIILENVKNRLKAGLNIQTIEDPYEIIQYCLTLEKLTCIKYLLDNYSDKLIGISKTSSTQMLLKQPIPDVAALEYVCAEEGYTKTYEMDNIKPRRVIRQDSEDRSIQKEFPIYEELSNRTFTTFFTRLDKQGNILKIELPYKLHQNNKKDKIESILTDLKSISINGYPYILKKAHDEVKIGKDNMEKIIMQLGIFEKTGRDMLE